MMKIVNIKDLKKYSDEDYVWYACYGSNINYKRFMYYINGDISGKYSSVTGCVDKSKPIEERKYLFNCPIYFAGTSKSWGGGMAFLDYENAGMAYGKIYKIKMFQFKEILKQEQSCKLYDILIMVDYIDEIPVLTFTSKHKLNNIIQKPSNLYLKVIKEGIQELYKELNAKEISDYLEEMQKDS